MNQEDYIQVILRLVEYSQFMVWDTDPHHQEWYGEIPGHKFRGVYAIHTTKSECEKLVEHKLREWVIHHEATGSKMPELSEVKRESRRSIEELSDIAEKKS